MSKRQARTFGKLEVVVSAAVRLAAKCSAAQEAARTHWSLLSSCLCLRCSKVASSDRLTPSKEESQVGDGIWEIEKWMGDSMARPGLVCC